MRDGPPAEPVVVAGAGPVGMSAALALRARGVPATILEAEPADRQRPGSRADYVHGATLEILEAIHPGLGLRVAEAGVNPPVRRTLWAGREVYAQEFDVSRGPDELPHSSRIPQTVVEAYLLEALDSRDVEIRWDTPVESLTVADDGVEIETGDGEAITAPYVIGADGGGSTVRKAVGIGMSGTESVNTFIIIDVDEIDDEPRPNELHFHYHHPGADGRNALIAPFAGGWRIDITCSPDEDAEALTTEPALSAIVGGTVGERYVGRVSWVSTYRFKQVTTDAMADTHRRVLLAGDAAHLFAPFGGRGMNSGIHDADAAASAIAVALASETPAVARREVENYARLRGTAAEWNTAAAGQALEHIYTERPLVNLKQRLAAEAARFYEPAGRWLANAPFGPHAGPPIPTKGKF